MASEYICKKWKTIFIANDLSGDGVIDVKDADIFAERFAKHHNMNSEDAKKLKKSYEEVWASLYLFDQTVMEPDTYIKRMSEEYTRDRAGFINRFKRTVRRCVELFDVNKDGQLSQEEYEIVLKCWGIESLDLNYVKLYPQTEPGYVSKEIFANSWIAFFTNDDENKAEVEQPVLIGLRIKL